MSALASRVSRASKPKEHLTTQSQSFATSSLFSSTMGEKLIDATPCFACTCSIRISCMLSHNTGTGSHRRSVDKLSTRAGSIKVTISCSQPSRSCGLQFSIRSFRRESSSKIHTFTGLASLTHVTLTANCGGSFSRPLATH